jgi:transglutaminase-like putative cysteine protease
MTRRSLLGPAAAGSVLLTMLALNQVFVRQRWLFPSIVAVGIAFGVGWVARRLDVPAVLSPALSVLALVTWLGLSFHAGTTMFGIPTGETMRAIGESFRQAGVDIRELAAPAEPTTALTLLSVTGVFLVAVIVDVMVFRLRRPVASGIPLLALFLVPTSLASKANAFAFVLAAFGYLGLLVAEGRDRARAWGRRLSGIDRLDDVADVSHVARVGRRLGTTAVGLALTVPVLFPSVGQGMISGSGGGLFGNGDSRVFVINPITEIANQLHLPGSFDLLTVRTTGPNGYLRLTSLDEFTGSQWQIIPQSEGSDHKVGGKRPIPQPREHQHVATTEQSFEVTVGDLGVQWLPVPYSPRVVDVRGDWKYEDPTLSIFQAKKDKTSQGVSFRVTSLLPEPTRDQLRSEGETPESIQKRYLQVPEGPVDDRVAAVLDQVAGDLPNPYDKAVALQRFFRQTGGFHYSLDAPAGHGTRDVGDFLENKVGYCEQYASAMAYLARLSGIPARVAVGFTPGHQRSDGTWVITNKDAHAWPELYFPNAGWVRFEPTPASNVRTPDYSVEERQPGDPGDGSVPPTEAPTQPPTSAPTATPPGGRGRDAAIEDQNGDGIADNVVPPNGGGDGGHGGAVAAGAVAFAGLLAVPSVVGYAARRRRRTRAGDANDRTHAAWETLADAAEDAGYPLRASDSPRAAARRLVTAAGLADPVAQEVSRLATAEERARYARSAEPVDGLDASARAVRKALMASLSRWARLRATVAPASSMRRIREGYGSLSVAMERSRVAVRARLRALVRRRAVAG